MTDLYTFLELMQKILVFYLVFKTKYGYSILQ